MSYKADLTTPQPTPPNTDKRISCPTCDGPIDKIRSTSYSVGEWNPKTERYEQRGLGLDEDMFFECGTCGHELDLTDDEMVLICF